MGAYVVAVLSGRLVPHSIALKILKSGMSLVLLLGYKYFQRRTSASFVYLLHWLSCQPKSNCANT